MSNLRAIKKRIGTVRNTQQITRAMKLVSGAKLRRAEERVRAFRPYADELRQTLTSLVARGEGLQHPLLQPGSSQAPRLYVLVSSDRGLCGAFNSNIIRTTLRHLEEEGLSPNDVVFYTVGRKSTEQAKRRGWQTLGSVAPLPEPPSPELVARIAGDLTEAFLAGAVGQVRIVYNQFINALTQRVDVAPLLPLSSDVEQPSGGAQIPYLTEPDPSGVLQALAPRLVEAQVEGALLDSIAGEHGARMTAMDSATTNASDMIHRLTLTYNRARQAAITSELLDIINGANSID